VQRKGLEEEPGGLILSVKRMRNMNRILKRGRRGMKHERAARYTGGTLVSIGQSGTAGKRGMCEEDR